VAGMTYREAGVDIDAGDALVERIKPWAAKTMRPEVLAGIGGFGALFALGSRYRDPVLVSGTDGVGTKLKLAFAWDCHDWVGQDLVAMSVNDILVQGAEPLFFLDYFACGRLDVAVAERVIAGIARACAECGCALIGGETAEMPDMYPAGEYDLAGFAVGVVERDQLIDGRAIAPGDAILGLASSGAHSNGYSLIRRILAHSGYGENLARDATLTFDGVPLRQAVMAPTRLYVRAILAARSAHPGAIRGLAHITGGGITENLPRILPAGTAAAIDLNTWPRPALFRWLQEAGKVDEAEMLRVFNCGIGMAVVVAKDNADEVAATLAAAGEQVYRIGSVIASSESPAVYYR